MQALGRGWLNEAMWDGLAGRPLDLAYATLGRLNGTFFSKGWGNLGIVDMAEDIEQMKKWPPEPLKVHLKFEAEGKLEGVRWRRYLGTFRTPCLGRVHDALPLESRTARISLVVPDVGAVPPAGVLHLAATGDHHFGRRMRLAMPMVAQGVASAALESPFYGARKPSKQRGSKLQYVSDLLVLGWATIFESLHLLHWMEVQGWNRRGVCGLSMGGVHACMVAGLCPTDVACAPLLAPRSAAVAYVDGAFQRVTAWQQLQGIRDGADNFVPGVVHTAAQAVNVMREASRALALQRGLEPAENRTWVSSVRQEELAGTNTCAHLQKHAHLSSLQQMGVAAMDTQAVSTSNAGTPAATANAGNTLRPQANTSASREAGSASQASRSNGVPTTGHLSMAPVQGTSNGQSFSLLSTLSHLQRGRQIEQQHCFQRLKAVLETYTERPHIQIRAAIAFAHTRFEDVTRYPRPMRPDAAVLVAARDDAYVSLASVQELHRYWEGSELRLVRGGHVSAFLMHQSTFRQAILDSLTRIERQT